MAGASGEYEPRDSRNVTGTASTPDGRWTNRSGKPLDAAGQPADPEDTEAMAEEGWDEGFDEADDVTGDDDEEVTFEPDPELEARIRRGSGERQPLGKIPGTDRPNPG